jgi:hypothetical protein
MQLEELEKWKNKYPMKKARAGKEKGAPRRGDLIQCVLDFLEGKNPRLLA